MISSRNPRLLNLSLFLVLAMLVSIGLLTWSDPVTGVSSIGLCVAFGAVYLLGDRVASTPRRMAAYFAVQALITTALMVLSGGSDTFNFLFFVLGIQAMLVLPLRPAALLIAAFYATSSFVVLWGRGIGGTVSLVFNAAVYFFTGAFGYILRQAETERQEKERLLEELQASQRQVQDLAVFEERNRLARDLHDSAKQRAFALSAQLDAVRSLIRRDPAAAEIHLQRAEQVADHLRQELANLILQLRPPEMERGGLPAALRQYGSEWSQQTNIALEVRVSGDRQLPADVEQALFRIAQEALANVARHSHALRAELVLSCAPDLVTLTIADAGRGFAIDQIKTGVGTRSMQERAGRLPNGKLTLESLPGQGTRVIAQCSP